MCDPCDLFKLPAIDPSSLTLPIPDAHRFSARVATPNHIAFQDAHSGQEMFRIVLYPKPTVELAAGVDWDAAARRFWNSVAMVAGQAAPFAEPKPEGIKTW